MSVVRGKNEVADPTLKRSITPKPADSRPLKRARVDVAKGPVTTNATRWNPKGQNRVPIPSQRPAGAARVPVVRDRTRERPSKPLHTQGDFLNVPRAQPGSGAGCSKHWSLPQRPQTFAEAARKPPPPPPAVRMTISSRAPPSSQGAPPHIVRRISPLPPVPVSKVSLSTAVRTGTISMASSSTAVRRVPVVKQPPPKPTQKAKVRTSNLPQIDDTKQAERERVRKLLANIGVDMKMPLSKEELPTFKKRKLAGR